MAQMCFELLRRRRLQGWTQAELAQRSGLGVRTVIRLERGEMSSPSAETLRQLAAALSVPVAELFPEVLGTSVNPTAAA